MKIATFNCNSIRSRLDTVLGWLEAQQPDVLCLQETKVRDEEFPVEEFRFRGWHAVFRGEKAYNGVAVVSKRVADEVQFGLDEEPRDEARLAYARFGGLHVVNTYVPQGRELEHPMYAYKLAWFERLKAWMQARFRPEDRVFWCGDLNVAREPLDIFRPETKTNHVCYHADVRAAFENVAAFGFTDLFRKHHPGEADYSFYDYRTPFNPADKRGWRIDYVMATAPLAAKSVSAGVDMTPRLGTKPSDHIPLFAEVEGAAF